MLPQSAPSHIQRRKPGSRGTVEPSGSLIGAPLASGSSSASTNAAGSLAIFSISSRAAASPRTLSGDQPRSNAALYSGRYSSAGVTSSSFIAAYSIRVAVRQEERVDILPSAECIAAIGSLHLEAEDTAGSR